MRRAGWERLSEPGDKLSSCWRHTSGWVVLHCGHQTALWPYMALDPEQRGTYVMSATGRGFANLGHAFDVLAAVFAGALDVVTDADGGSPVRFVSACGERNWDYVALIEREAAQREAAPTNDQPQLSLF